MYRRALQVHERAPVPLRVRADLRGLHRLILLGWGARARPIRMDDGRVNELTEDEAAIVALVREFVDRDVKPAVRELEHADTYPEELIERMKQLGVFGLAIPSPWGDAAVSTPCYAAVTEELARGWMSLAGAMGGSSSTGT